MIDVVWGEVNGAWGEVAFAMTRKIALGKLEQCWVVNVIAPIPVDVYK